MQHLLNVTVNGQSHTLVVNPNTTLLDMLRNNLGLTGTKKGCELGDCGACTVILDGKTVNSCLVLAVEASGKEVLTIEGLAEGSELHPLQKAFIDYGAIQCGYCTPGMILSAKALLEGNPSPSQKEIKAAIGGNLCRCTGYIHIIEAISEAAGKEKE
jgi:carbon-monoxide dehydrogenase small subunit